jgi:hypothetical protein
MPNLAVFPRGYSVLTDDLTVSRVVEGDTEVIRLYSELNQKRESEIDWEFKRQVLFCAKRLIGSNFAKWVTAQEQNKYLNGKAIRFVADTIKFIVEGRREITNVNWLPLLSNEPTPGVLQNRDYSLSREHIKASVELGDFYLSKWLSQSNGFNDLVVTLFILYGSADRKDLRSKASVGVTFPTTYAATAYHHDNN